MRKKYINGFGDRYLIYEDGRIEQKYGDKYIEKKPYDKGNGYLAVNLYRPGHRHKMHLVHRLVAIHFLQNTDKKKVVNHKDRNKKNNHVNNLEWVTNQENLQHAVDKGFRVHRKLNNMEIATIRYVYDKGFMSAVELAKDFEQKYETVLNIVNRQSYVSIQAGGKNYEQRQFNGQSC
ncbi:TPA: HNH endonuclease signature motif containing protein [Streptococcus suis]